jgi:molybdopterin-synthase adenylyltransferase
VSGVLGCLAALEAVKLVARFGEPLRGILLTMDLTSLEFRKCRVRRDPGCRVCGTTRSHSRHPG